MTLIISEEMYLVVTSQFRMIFQKEIAVQNQGNTQQLFRINTFPFENRINIGAFATQLTCEPSNTSFLPAKFFLYKTANVHHEQMTRPTDSQDSAIHIYTKKTWVSLLFAYPTYRLSHSLNPRISNCSQPTPRILHIRNINIINRLNGFLLKLPDINTPYVNVPVAVSSWVIQICEICTLKITSVNVLLPIKFDPHTLSGQLSRHKCKQFF